MLANEPYVVADTDTDLRLNPSDLEAYRNTTIRAVICIPLHKNGRFTAAMAVHQKTPRTWTSEEIELVELVVNRCWESLKARTGNAQLAGQRSEVPATCKYHPTARLDGESGRLDLLVQRSLVPSIPAPCRKTWRVGAGRASMMLRYFHQFWSRGSTPLKRVNHSK